CNELGIPFTSTMGVINARDKARARELIAASGMRSLNWALVHDVDDLYVAIERIGYPFILKPVSGFDSFLAQRVDTADQAKELAGRGFGIAGVPDPVHRQLRRGYLVEEYQCGDLVSAEIGRLNGRTYRFLITGRSIPEVEECVGIGAVLPAAISRADC